MSLLDQIDFMRRGHGVNRYHQRYTAVTDTVGKHSAGVAGFLILLQEGGALPRAAALAAAIVHDLPECETGDIPAPAKRAMSPAARHSLSELEESLLRQHGFEYDLSEDEQRLLKLADYLDGLMFCVEEMRRGNREVSGVGDVYCSYIAQYMHLANARERSVVQAVTNLWSKEKHR